MKLTSRIRPPCAGFSFSLSLFCVPCFSPLSQSSFCIPPQKNLKAKHKPLLFLFIQHRYCFASETRGQGFLRLGSGQKRQRFLLLPHPYESGQPHSCPTLLSAVFLCFVPTIFPLQLVLFFSLRPVLGPAAPLIYTPTFRKQNGILLWIIANFIEKAGQLSTYQQILKELSTKIPPKQGSACAQCHSGRSFERPLYGKRHNHLVLSSLFCVFCKRFSFSTNCFT